MRAHSQTVGALVAEKTELEARLAHLERAAEERNRELQSLSAARNESLAKLREAQDAVQLANSSAAHSESAKNEAMRQVGMPSLFPFYIYLTARFLAFYFLVRLVDFLFPVS